MSSTNNCYTKMKSIVSFWNCIQPKRYSCRCWTTAYTLHHYFNKTFTLRSYHVKLWLSQCGLPVMSSHFHAKLKLLLLFTSVDTAEPTPLRDWCGLSSFPYNDQQSSQSPWQLFPFVSIEDREIEHCTYKIFCYSWGEKKKKKSFKVLVEFLG